MVCVGPLGEGKAVFCEREERLLKCLARNIRHSDMREYAALVAVCAAIRTS